MLRVGTTLRGIYRIDSYLSSGGFGNTYVATNIEFDERVAVKEFFMKGVTQRDGEQTTVSVSNIENQESFLQQREKFKKEARRLRLLNNPHIVRVHDLFEENGTAYYVMDYVDGENLSDRLKRTGRPMTESEVNRILPQILDALKSVHDADIWHLDLKPANIMIDKSGQVKLIDFGASKQLNAQKGGATTSTAISYTNGYAPREQMEQNYDKFGPWTDIYALGATLYSLLTNKRPPLPTDIDDDISEDKHLALPMLNVSDAMKNLVLCMMKTNRTKRPQSVIEIKNETSSNIREVENIRSQDNASNTMQDLSEETIIGESIEEQREIAEGIEQGERKHANKKWLLAIIIAVLGIIGILFFYNKERSTPMVADNDNLYTDTLVIYHPNYKTTSDDGWLSVNQIIITAEETRIDFEYINRYEQGGWCSISENTYLTDGNTQYKMKQAINIAISPKQTGFSQQWQSLNFTLIFPPIKEGIKSIDFIEEEGSSWNLKNISLDTNYYVYRDSIISSMLNTCFDQEAISGTFTMGNADWENSDPPSRVTLSKFLMSRYEVTQEQWECIMRNNPSYFKGKNLPVTNVSWNDCQAYISELVRVTGGIPFQLPTEAQWEFAARGGTKSKRYQYAGGNDLNKVAWYSDNSSNSIHEIGQKTPNELGLYDMSGNVWEWCLDYYANYNAKSKNDPNGPNSGELRVYRGGSYNEKAKANNYGYSDFWVFARNADKPSSSYSNVGFRLVINLPNQ